ncbi:hypothetical protein PpBr36_07375 [Pyricularia pennisetigena]|uniref:hypothetical protein n=1 Tax=Pyricularia pennisetigena TaxID=1578925 RepID=UPI00115384B8|nr:hypothetical protein PpBr36_07375 [Pyricularia pennisetigena]TLS25937.1 hypothetical protein PpBr36_07375 [Pyricularia pennisetigena]
MGFGEGVAKLLDTYTNCLRQLKIFKKQHGSDSDDASSLLRSSIRSDRSQIRRAYSTRLSENGKRLVKGDSRSRGMIRKTLKKLNAAISGLMQSSKDQQPFLDYESLQRLSNSSRVDAVSAIDQLSQRLGNATSRNSLVSSASVGDRRRYSTRSDKSNHKLPKGTQQKLSKTGVRSQLEDQRGSRSRSRSKPRYRSRERCSPNQHHSGASVASRLDRLSMMSSSTDSTKLGEIPERRRLRRQNIISNDSDSSGCYPAHVRPAYPLKPYPSPEPRSRPVWRLFGRR